MGEARHQRINIPIQPVQPGHLGRDPAPVQHAIFRQISKNPRQHGRMAVSHGLAEIRNLGHLPEQTHPARRICQSPHLSPICQLGQALLIHRISLACQKGPGRRGLQRFQQPVQPVKIKRPAAPEKLPQGREPVPLNRLYHLLFQRAGSFGHAKAAIAGMAACPACYLGQLSSG